ncbi:MAG: hypothetical protein QW175_00970 [Candidatus Bathyarchaeia archaeon]
MAAPIDRLEEKWYRKAMAALKAKWVPAVQSATSLEAFIKGISAVTGIPEGTIRASLPAMNWAEFQKRASEILPLVLEKVEAAYRAKKWSVHYKRAFGGS